MISEVKTDDSFSTANFSQPYKADRNSSGSGIMLYVKKDIPSNLIKIESLLMEGFYVELKSRK